MLMQVLVLSKLDYCNSTFAGSTEYNIRKLQHIQNMACRVVHNLCKHDRISLPMCNLHWLRVHECIEYKLAVLMFKCYNGTVPKYLSDLVIYEHNRHLRSEAARGLPILRCRLTFVQNSSFHSIGPRLWNSLPKNIRESSTLEQFKSKSKTHLFKTPYSDILTLNSLNISILFYL